MYCKKCGMYNSGNSLQCKNCGDYFVNQFDDTTNLEDEIINNLSVDNDTVEKNDKKENKDRKKVKTKYKKIKTKEKKKKNHKLWHSDKNNDKSNKSKNSKSDNYKEKEVIVKSSLASKLTILFLIILVIILFGICSIMGIYLLKDKVVKMPDLVGLSSNEAISILDNNKIKYEIIESKSDATNVDKVIEQDPDAGTYFFKNKTVEIVIGSNESSSKKDYKSSEKTDDKIELKNYVGMNINDVKLELEYLGLKYDSIEIESDEATDIIIKQEPINNSIITKDTTIILYVSAPKDNDNKEEDNSNDTTSNNIP